MKVLQRCMLTGVFLTVFSAACFGEAFVDNRDVQAEIFLSQAWLENRLNYDRVPGASIAPR